MTSQPPFVLQGYTPAVVTPPPAVPTLNVDEVMDEYRRLRAQKENMQERHKEELLPIREAMDDIEVQLLRFMTLTGLSNVGSGDAIAYKQTRTRSRIADPHQFRQWCEANGRVDMYENRISQEALDNYLALGNDLPPGVEVNSEVVVNVRKK